MGSTLIWQLPKQKKWRSKRGKSREFQPILRSLDPPNNTVNLSRCGAKRGRWIFLRVGLLPRAPTWTFQGRCYKTRKKKKKYTIVSKHIYPSFRPSRGPSFCWPRKSRQRHLVVCNIPCLVDRYCVAVWWTNFSCHARDSHLAFKALWQAGNQSPIFGEYILVYFCFFSHGLACPAALQ